jgi:hypothetical protein
VAGIEDAGLEVRDQILWLFGQGLPKSRRFPGGRAGALKPAFEPILLARAPLAATLPENLERYGTGALNIEAASIARQGAGTGYWPANVTFSHSPDCPEALIAEPASGPSHLFYCAKATRAEREAGCGQLPVRQVPLYTGRSRKPRLVRNARPTVKPLALMRWLIWLATPEGSIVLDPFAGSGTTASPQRLHPGRVPAWATPSPTRKRPARTAPARPMFDLCSPPSIDIVCRGSRVASTSPARPSSRSLSRPTAAVCSSAANARASRHTKARTR